MTPRQKHFHEVSNDVIIHELGHTIVGYELGILEGGIQLCDPATGELARAHYSTIGTSCRQRIIRGLAGAYTQARMCPKLLPSGLSDQLLDGSIFYTFRSDIDTNIVPQLIVDAGFYGDWGNIIQTARETTLGVAGVLSELESAHRDLVVLYLDRQIESKVSRAKRDFEQWLDQDDDDVPFMPTLIYPITRLKKALDQRQC